MSRASVSALATGAVAALASPWWLTSARFSRLLASPAPHAAAAGRNPAVAIRAAFLTLRILAWLRLSLWRNTCLYRSTAECLVLRHYGMRCHLQLGVIADSGTDPVTAHAWVVQDTSGAAVPSSEGYALLK